MSKELIDLKKNFEKIYFNENLSRYSWFNLGGTVDVFFKPKTLEGDNENLLNLVGFIKTLFFFSFMVCPNKVL